MMISTVSSGVPFLLLLPCLLLLLLLSTVVEGKTFQIDWRIPSTGIQYEERYADIGDTIIFHWETATHNVYLQPSGTCNDRTNEILIGLNPGTTYTIPDYFSGRALFFTCNVGTHCETNLHVTFNINGPLVPIPSPTNSPTIILPEGGSNPTPAPGREGEGGNEPSSSGSSNSFSEEPSFWRMSMMMMMMTVMIVFY